MNPFSNRIGSRTFYNFLFSGEIINLPNGKKIPGASDVINFLEGLNQKHHFEICKSMSNTPWYYAIGFQPQPSKLQIVKN